MDHTWQFFRAGGVDQAVILTGADIAHLGDLDQKLWVALACPTRGIQFDTRTLDLMDSDGDGRIRPPELIAACRWACEQLIDADDLIRGGDRLEIAAIDTGTDSGQEIAEEARRILALLGKHDESVICLDDVSDRSRLVAAMRFNGDGVIAAKTAKDPQVARVIQFIVDTQGSVKDLSGDEGIDQPRVDTFFDHADRLRDWHAQILGDSVSAPLGEATGAALAALEVVRGKVDDYFARCRLAAYDERAVAALNPSFERYGELSGLSLSLASTALAELPLAAAEARRNLSLRGDAVNPAWAEALARFAHDCLEPLCGKALTDLDETRWLWCQERLAPYRDWLATRPATSLDGLSVADVDEIANGEVRTAINNLLQQDIEIAPQTERMVDLERLLRYRRDLLRLLHNFVSFKQFYRREGAIFEAGTLYLDGRSCDLTIQVADLGRHATLAGMAKACLAYCECRRRDAKMVIVAAFTAGDTDFLFIGRNGIFYDRQGNDWDATVVKMIENPTNVRQAFLSPYKKLIRALEEQVAKRAAASDASVQGGLGAAAGGLLSTGSAATGVAGANAAASKIDVGTVAALGVALGSISAVLVGLFGKFVDLGWWIPVALLGLLLAISGPSMLIAWLKLRERSLGPILDASGWAINSRLKVNMRLGRLISQSAHIPLTSKHPLRDPYADRNLMRYLVAASVLVAFVAVLVWRFGWLDKLLPEAWQYRTVANWVKRVGQLPTVSAPTATPATKPVKGPATPVAPTPDKPGPAAANPAAGSAAAGSTSAAH